MESWHQDWTVDLREDAEVQALHKSGIGISIFPSMGEEGVFVWVSARSYDLNGKAALKRQEIGEAAFHLFEARLCDEAYRLWMELGFTADNVHFPPDLPYPLPCRVIVYQ